MEVAEMSITVITMIILLVLLILHGILYNPFEE